MPATASVDTDAPLGGALWTLRDDACPLEGFSAVDRTTGEVAWTATCKSARCYRCSRMVSARSFALARRALAEMNPKYVRFVTLTLAPEDWQELRKRMQDLVQFLRRDRGIKVKWLWVVEEGKETGMRHVHAVQWGDFIPWQELLAWWGSRVQIEAADAAIGYLGKNIIRYLGKGLDGDRDAIEGHMNLNGGRAAHWSRGFFNGLGRDAFAAEYPLPGVYFLEHELLGEGIVTPEYDGPVWEPYPEQGEVGPIAIARPHEPAFELDEHDPYWDHLPADWNRSPSTAAAARLVVDELGGSEL